MPSLLELPHDHADRGGGDVVGLGVEVGSFDGGGGRLGSVCDRPTPHLLLDLLPDLLLTRFQHLLTRAQHGFRFRRCGCVSKGSNGRNGGSIRRGLSYRDDQVTKA